MRRGENSSRKKNQQLVRGYGTKSILFSNIYKPRSIKQILDNTMDLIYIAAIDPIYCARIGYLEYFKIAQLNVLLTSRDSARHSVLSIAADQNHLECCEEIYRRCPMLLYSRGADGETALHLAAWRANPKIVKFLLSVDAENKPINGGDGEGGAGTKLPNQKLQLIVNKNHETALHLAVEKGNLEIIKMLTEADHDKELLRMTDRYQETALHIAVRNGNLATVKLMLEAGADCKLLRKINKSEHTALHMAVIRNNREIAEVLIEVDSDRKLLRMVDYQKRTCLHMAVERGNVDIVRLLIKADTDNELLQMVDMNKETCLHLAVQKGNLGMVSLLIEADLDNELLKMVDGSKHTALHMAVKHDNLEVLKFLIKVDSDKELLKMVNSLKETALHMAVKEEKLQMVNLFIQADPDDELLLMTDWNRETALHLAVEKGNLDLVRLMTEADPDKRFFRMVNVGGDTALHLAVRGQLFQIVESLVEADTEFEYCANDSGDTPILIAMRGALSNQKSEDHRSAAVSEKIKKLLLERNPRQSTVRTGENGWTLLHHATERQDLSTIEDITKVYPECMEIADNKGQNFLHLAARLQCDRVVRHVLRIKEVSARILNGKDKDGHTPLHLAALSGHESMTKSLLYDPRVDKKTVNRDGQEALDAVNFEYDKRKARVHGLWNKVDQKEIKEQSDFDLLVGALIATVSFTAGITVPGGYVNDGPNTGTAVLSKKRLFQAFVLSNAFALLLALYAVFSHFCARRLINDEHIKYQLNVATFCTLAAMLAMLVAFITGSYTVLENSDGLAITLCVMCCLFVIFAIRPLWKMVTQGSRYTS